MNNDTITSYLTQAAAAEAYGDALSAANLFDRAAKALIEQADAMRAIVVAEKGLPLANRRKNAKARLVAS